MWADETARVGAGVGIEVMRRRERRGGKWAVGPENPGRAAASHLRYGQLLTPQLLPPLGSSPGCQANASGPSSELGGNHGFFDASFPISESHGPPASQL